MDVPKTTNLANNKARVFGQIIVQADGQTNSTTLFYEKRVNSPTEELRFTKINLDTVVAQ
jgi:hypothetical protein